MCLNTLAGRSYNDLMQYPVFPWIIADYDSEVCWKQLIVFLFMFGSLERSTKSVRFKNLTFFVRYEACEICFIYILLAVTACSWVLMLCLSVMRCSFHSIELHLTLLNNCK
jgi:hypothetical protein